MKKCFRFLAALVIVGFFAGCGQGKQAEKSIPDTPENRAAQAKRYMEAVPPSEMMANIGRNMAANAPQERASQFMKSFTENLDMAAVERAMHESLTKTFTADELRALADFFGSPVGKSAMAKYGAYLASIMPVIQQEVGKAMQKSLQGVAPQEAPKEAPGAAPEAPSPAPAPPPKNEG